MSSLNIMLCVRLRVVFILGHNLWACETPETDFLFLQYSGGLAQGNSDIYSESAKLPGHKNKFPLFIFFHILSLILISICFPIEDTEENSPVTLAAKRAKKNQIHHHQETFWLFCVPNIPTAHTNNQLPCEALTKYIFLQFESKWHDMRGSSYFFAQ